ncbi:MAG: ArsR/SmtB family transcription factor [Candidatus Hodarchaeales archaeon]
MVETQDLSSINNEIFSRISFFAMIADPIRHAIIYELLHDPKLSVNQILERLNKPQTLVSYHLRCLRECGILDRNKCDSDGRKYLYSLYDPEFIRTLFDLTDDFLKNHEVCKTHPACRMR